MDGGTLGEERLIRLGYLLNALHLFPIALVLLFGGSFWVFEHLAGMELGDSEAIQLLPVMYVPTSPLMMVLNFYVFTKLGQRAARWQTSLFMGLFVLDLAAFVYWI